MALSCHGVSSNSMLATCLIVTSFMSSWRSAVRSSLILACSLISWSSTLSGTRFFNCERKCASARPFELSERSISSLAPATPSRRRSCLRADVSAIDAM